MEVECVVSQQVPTLMSLGIYTAMYSLCGTITDYQQKCTNYFKVELNGLSQNTVIQIY